VLTLPKDFESGHENGRIKSDHVSLLGISSPDGAVSHRIEVDV
jgi:hypothetical protein